MASNRLAFLASRQFRASNADYGYGPHFAYMGDLAIEIVTPEWPTRDGAFYLRIANVEFFSDNLRELETRLLAFAESEGYFEHAR